MLADSESNVSIGPLHVPLTWYKLGHAGTQVAQCDFQNKATRSSPLSHAFDLEIPLCVPVCYFVPCDRIVQKAYCCFLGPLFVKKFPSQSSQERQNKEAITSRKRKTVFYHDLRISSSDSVKPFDITAALPSSMLKIPTPN